MRRGNAIALTAATAGVLVAGSIAAAAVMSATNAPTQPETILLVDATSAAAASPAPSLIPQDLPSLTLPSEQPVTIPEPVATAVATNDATSTSTSTQPSTITRAQARNAVLTETDGTVLGVSRTEHQGYSAFAVRVQRTNGSVITGYVDRESGVVYDWVQNAAAPAPSANAKTSDDDEAEYESDDNTKSSSSDDESDSSEHDHDSDDD